MAQYNTLIVKCSNSQLNKLKSRLKNDTQVTLKLVKPNEEGNSNDENSFPRTLVLTNTQVLRLRKAFANISSANIKLSKTQLSKIGQPGGFLGRHLGPLLKAGFPLTKNVLKQLAKSFLIPLGLTAAASATDSAVQKKIFELNMSALIISNEEIYDIIKIIKSLEEFGLLIKSVSETIKNEENE